MADDVEQWIESVRADAVDGISAPGDWLSGAQRLASWFESRSADSHPLDRARRSALTPLAVDGAHQATEMLSAAAVEVVHRVGSDPGRLTKRWAEEQIDELGAEVYTELVGVASIVRALDTFSVAMGEPVVDLPPPVSGDPIRERPDDVGEVGAWVPQSVNKARANVSRALSLVPRTNEIWRTVVDSHYSRGQQFMELAWSRALSRVQVEAVAARTTIALDCFY